MIAVTGGRAGVGTTTVAVNLAAVLADRADRVLLVDAAEQRANMTEIAGVSSTTFDYWLSDLVTGKCTAEEAIRPGPAGTLLLASRRNRNLTPYSFRNAQQRLFAELQALRGEIDLVVVDIGSGLTPWTRRFWLRAQLVLVVTTTDAPTLLDTYAMIKRSVVEGIAPDVRLLVNRCDHDQSAADVQHRISNACSRFLGRTMPALPSLPLQLERGDKDSSRVPRVWQVPNTPFGHAALWLGRAVSDVLSTARNSTHLVPHRAKNNSSRRIVSADKERHHTGAPA